MIIGHLPAGYLAARALDPAFDRDPVIFWSLLAGSILPDFDMLRFYLLDDQGVHHHTYITHDPTLWAGVLTLGLLLASRLLIGVGIGALLHMMLDTTLGAITWGYGRFSVSGPIIEVPATQDHWILSFLVHWTFGVEIALVLISVALMLRSPRKSDL